MFLGTGSINSIDNSSIVQTDLGKYFCYNTPQKAVTPELRLASRGL